MATKLAHRLPRGVPAQTIFDLATIAHGDLHRRHGFSPLQLLIGRTPDGVGLQQVDLGNASATLASAPMTKKLTMQQAAYETYIQEHMSEEAYRKKVHQSRPSHTWASGEKCWYWRSGKKSKEYRSKHGIFRGPATVLLQERETRQGEVQHRGVVWVVDGDVIIRCAPQHLRALTDSEKLLKCSLSDTENQEFQQFAILHRT